MYVLLALGVLSFLLCMVLTPLCRDLFLRAGLVDQPDGDRKAHARPVPRVGGIPIVLSCAGSFAFLFLLYDRRLYVQHGQVLHGALPAAGLMFLVGLADDVFNLKPLQKLAGQVIAATLAVALGVRLSLGHVSPAICVLFSIGWLISCTNAVNLIDGMDGLATGVGLLATLTTLGMALLYGHYGLALITAPLVGALIAFLRYNFPPASVFLGDCGSLTIGFLLGCFGLVWSQHAHTVVALAAPLMALALPLADMGLAIGRRFLRNAPIFQGDRRHIHHRVLALGFSTRGTAFILYGICGAFAVLAVLASTTGHTVPVMLTFVLLVCLGVSRLGYVEFAAVARQAMAFRSIRSAVQGTICVEDFELALRSANSVEACWEVLRTVCRELRFMSARFDIQGRSFQESFFERPNASSFSIEFRFGTDSILFLTRPSEDDSPRVTMQVLHRLESVMRLRLRQLGEDGSRFSTAA